MDNDKDLTVRDAQVDYNRQYTVDDYHSWDESFRAELYEGTLVVMEAPSRKHQGVLTEILVQLHTFLKGKPCRVYPAPFSVRLCKNEETIFEPDLVVICDESKFNDKGCDGAPDLVIEILSPSTARMDRILKLRKYREAGVREYWIVDPELDYLHVGVLKDGEFVFAEYDKDEIAPISVLEGCEINLADVFSRG